MTAAVVVVASIAVLDVDAPAEASNPCPADMKLVEHDHFDEIEHDCTDQRGKYCFAFAPGVTHTKSPAPDHERFCMDTFEAPNQQGAPPIVMKTGNEAAAWCESKGKRLCNEAEWETACEGPDMKPWVYGWKADPEPCNSGKTWRQFDERALASGGDTAEAEVKRLWQGEPSGARSKCVSAYGVYDLVGNVEEWVTARPNRPFKMALMGGFWAKPWTGCRGTNDAHEPGFRFYEVGFRCCKDPR